MKFFAIYYSRSEQIVKSGSGISRKNSFAYIKQARRDTPSAGFQKLEQRRARCGMPKIARFVRISSKWRGRNGAERRPGRVSTGFGRGHTEHYIYNVSYSGGERGLVESAAAFLFILTENLRSASEPATPGASAVDMEVKQMNQKCSKTGRRSGGFTLVELIVVIAILAILAGVAYPVYTGYINKANEAADQMLLEAVNDAFRSALIDEGVHSGKPDNAMAILNDSSNGKNKKIGTVSYLIGSEEKDLTGTFNRYFDGNEESEFKVIKELGYNKLAGCFYGSYTTKEGQKILLGGNNSLTRGKTDIYGNTEWTWEKDGKTYTLTTNEQDLANFNGSNFSTNMTMEELMGEIQQVTDAATVLFRNIMGADVALTKEMQDKLIELGYVPDTDEYNKAAMNALVLQVAKQSSIYSADDIIAYMKKEVTALDAPESSAGDGMMAVAAAPYAAKYAVITAFVNSPGGRKVKMKFHDESLGGYYEGTLGDYYDTYFKEKLNSANASQATGAISKLAEALRDNADYQKYLNEGNGKADLEGYFSALSMVRDNSDEFIRSGVIDQGYGSGNSDLTEMLSALFGNGG